MDFTLTKVEDVGNDILRVEAVRGEETLVAVGWVSAITNHFDADAYGEDGHRAEGAKPRERTKVEVGEYARSLIEAAYSESAPPEPVPVAFS